MHPMTHPDLDRAYECAEHVPMLRLAALLPTQVRWQIGKIPKDKLPVLTGTVLLGPGRSSRELSLSLFVNFKVTMYSASGLKVASLRVENEEHQPYKGVRSITHAGRFEVRC